MNTIMNQRAFDRLLDKLCDQRENEQRMLELAAEQYALGQEIQLLSYAVQHVPDDVDEDQSATEAIAA